ncbi:MAG TPA: VOC family protein [Pyrinomonadaceae bacterium]|nr:VOC family protein [Pyrinomonadaceae bacterium]
MELARIIFFTHDVRRMVDFYTAMFGLEIIGEFHEEWTELAAGGCNVAFHRTHVQTDIRDDDGVKIAFGVDDVAKEKARLESLGVDMAEIRRFGKVEMCDGSDPDGRRFQISSRGT